MRLRAFASLALTALALMLPTQAFAFCGFYVSGADEKMFNDATQVVMMRRGTTTVLSMRNTYEGPPKDFAMVVPVPVVLEEADVKVLPDHLFKKVDALSAPRLVEYWERDPCKNERHRFYDFDNTLIEGEFVKPTGQSLGVKVEATFAVGEYDVSVLSANESNGLETWLKQEKYNVPEGAASVLEPYVAGGMYFFVAKVDPSKVTFEGGRAVLSPLRFHYDSEDFALPVRLGLLNTSGEQDLIVNILASEQRYEVANRPNVTIPTNLIVEKATKEKFGEFYTALFDFTLEANPGAVVTEYAWQATKCDPCPDGSFGAGLGGALNERDIATLGGDVLTGLSWRDLVLTRLHARYGRDDLTSDLIFAAAPPITGGRGAPEGPKAWLSDEGGAAPAEFNNFQGRYVMLNPWEGEVACGSPVRGRWGGPPTADDDQVTPSPSSLDASAGGVEIGDYVARPSLDALSSKGLKTSASIDPNASWPPPRPRSTIDTQRRKNSCAAAPSEAPSGLPLIALVLLGAFGRSCRQRPPSR